MPDCIKTGIKLVILKSLSLCSSKSSACLLSKLTALEVKLLQLRYISGTVLRGIKKSN